MIEDIRIWTYLVQGNFSSNLEKNKTVRRSPGCACMGALLRMTDKADSSALGEGSLHQNFLMENVINRSDFKLEGIFSSVNPSIVSF